MQLQKISAPLIVLIGPTAIGKTSLSLDLAAEFQCEIISVDSMQVYRHMDIGTAKASLAERQFVPHHLIDVVDPDQHYDAAKYAKDARKAIAKIHGRGKIPLLTGGTGLYLRAVLYGIFPGAPESLHYREKLKIQAIEEGLDRLHEDLSRLDPQTASRLHKNDGMRIIRALEVYYSTGKPLSVHLMEHQKSVQTSLYENVVEFGLTMERAELYNRINQRCEEMVQAGLEEEVKKLLHMGYGEGLPAMKSIGYRHMMQYINNYWQHTEMMNFLKRDTRRYAKRQYTWFSKNKAIQWFTVTDGDSLKKDLRLWLQARL